MLRSLVEQLADDYDLDPARIQSWIKSKAGLAQFSSYLNNIGYKTSTYAWPDEKDPMSCGLDFEDDNPQLIALKLKHIDYGEHR
jgi:hypothetical protein